MILILIEIVCLYCNHCAKIYSCLTSSIKYILKYILIDTFYIAMQTADYSRPSDYNISYILDTV